MLKAWAVMFLLVEGMFFSGNSFADESPYIKTQWKGISNSDVYSEDVHRLIKNKSCFKKEWENLRINSPLPEVDFSKDMVIEIIKKDTTKELNLKDIFVMTGFGGKSSIYISYDAYIDSITAGSILADGAKSYFFLVLGNSDLSFTIEEYRYKYTAKIKYELDKCDYKFEQEERKDKEKRANISNKDPDVQASISAKAERIFFLDDFNDGNFAYNPRWYYKDNNGQVVTGIEGDVHNSWLKWEVLTGYLCFAEGDFTGLDLTSDEIFVPAGLKKLVVEFDTLFGGTWAHHNMITLEDAGGKVVFGGGIYYDEYAYYKGHNKTNNGLIINWVSESYKKELPDASLGQGVWKHVKIIFDNGSIKVDCDYGKFSFTQAVQNAVLPEIRRIKIGGWQHTKGAEFDNISVQEYEKKPPVVVIRGGQSKKESGASQLEQQSGIELLVR